MKVVTVFFASLDIREIAATITTIAFKSSQPC
jgi:hypothetical protein